MANPTDMNRKTLRHFSHQLLNWCHERMHLTPGPFRQAELCSELIAEHGPHPSPLVLWVNRESLQAGSVVLLPDKDDSGLFDPACATARALGLPFFFLWGKTEISCWSTTGERPEKAWHLVLPSEDTASPTGFRKAFNQLIDQAESFYYMHQPDIPAMSDAYLANLVHLTILDLLPELRKSSGSSQTESGASGIAEADLKSFLLQRLLLPIALAAERKLPRRVRPERLDEALLEAGAELPSGLRPVLTKESPYIAIPSSCQRRLSLYVNRVDQLDGRLAETAANTVRLLLSRWAKDLGGAPFTCPPTGRQLALINPDRCLTDPAPAVEIGPVGILAATAMIRHFAHPGSGTTTEQHSDCLELAQILPGHHLVGTLHDVRVPKAAERKRLNALLRVSWPNHKLALTGAVPTWAWQFLHLCGLLAGDSRLELHIPKNWLWEKYGQSLFSILHGKLLVTTACDVDEQMMLMRLIPAGKPVDPVVRLRDGRERPLRHGSSCFLRSNLLLAMVLPDPLYRLLETGELEFRSPEKDSPLPRKGLQNYLYSSLGQDLWNLLAPGKSLPDGEKLVEKMTEYCIPLPGEKVLNALTRLKTPDRSGANEAADEELTSWFGPLPRLQRPKRRTAQKTSTPLPREALDSFLQNCCAEEIPVFPDNYLYHVPANERIEYRLDGPLQIVDTFFDETILQGSTGKLSVRGPAQAEALVMVSLTRSGVIELPRSQSATKEILDRYRRDLRTLRQIFSAHAAALSVYGNATGLVDRAWKDRGLPDWNLIKNR